MENNDEIIIVAAVYVPHNTIYASYSAFEKIKNKLNEIDSLKAKIKELEEQLNKSNNALNNGVINEN